MKTMLETFQNIVEQRNICGGLNVTGGLIGVQGDFSNFCCFLCLCDSRCTAKHYIRRDWEPGKT